MKKELAVSALLLMVVHNPSHAYCYDPGSLYYAETNQGTIDRWNRNVEEYRECIERESYEAEQERRQLNSTLWLLEGMRDESGSLQERWEMDYRETERELDELNRQQRYRDMEMRTNERLR